MPDVSEKSQMTDESSPVPPRSLVGPWAEQVVTLLKAFGNRPRVHGNGFIQLDITPNIRLHVWGDPRIPKQATETPIHDHTFGFTSYVLVGALENIVYQTRPSSVPNNAPAGVHVPHRATVRVGEDTVLSPIGGPCEMYVFVRHVTAAGKSYHMLPYEIHQSRPMGVTVSVIVKDGPSLAQGGPSPTVFVPQGVTPDNEFNRYAAEPELLWDIIRDALRSARAQDRATIQQQAETLADLQKKLHDAYHCLCKDEWEDRIERLEATLAEREAQHTQDTATIREWRDALSDLVDACYMEGSSSSWRCCQVCSMEHRREHDQTHNAGCVVDAAERLLRRYQKTLSQSLAPLAEQRLTQGDAAPPEEAKARLLLARQLDHPRRSVMSAVLKLTSAEQDATSATLSLRETGALLTHLRRAIRLARWDLQKNQVNKDAALAQLRQERDEERNNYETAAQVVEQYWRPKCHELEAQLAAGDAALRALRERLGALADGFERQAQIHDDAAQMHETVLSPDWLIREHRMSARIYRECAAELSPTPTEGKDA